MGVLSDSVQDLVRRVKLGFAATVNPDGTPNLSPKGTTTVFDADHLVFADIKSPGTVRNLWGNPAIEVNVVDPFARKGYRFKGRAEVVTSGQRFEQAMAMFRSAGLRSPVRTVVIIRVERVLPLISPGYAAGHITEAEMRERWIRYYTSLDASAPSDG